MPPHRDIVEVDPVHTVLPNQHHEQMPEREEHMADSGQPHEHPRVFLEVRHAGPPARRPRIVQAGGPVVAAQQHRRRPAPAPFWRTHRKCSAMCAPNTINAGARTATKTTPTIHSISRWWRGPSDQESIKITRIPLSA